MQRQPLSCLIACMCQVDCGQTQSFCSLWEAACTSMSDCEQSLLVRIFLIYEFIFGKPKMHPCLALVFVPKCKWYLRWSCTHLRQLWPDFVKSKVELWMMLHHCMCWWISIITAAREIFVPRGREHNIVGCFHAKQKGYSDQLFSGAIYRYRSITKSRFTL